MSPTPAEPFTRASLHLGPILERYGFRLVARDYHDEEAEGSASAEYRHDEVALRLNWDGTARALWLESARVSGGATISRWVDVEWIAAGERRDVDPAIDDPRIERMAAALRQVLSGGEATAS